MIICSPSSSASPMPAPAPVAVRPYGLISRAAKSSGPVDLDQPRRPDQRARRRGRLQDQLEDTSTRTGAGAIISHSQRRLARLHRQILADRAGPRPECADRGQLPQERRTAPIRPITRASRPSSPPGKAITTETHIVRRRQGKGGCSTATRTAGIAKLSQVDRLGLVRMVHAADLRSAAVAVPRRPAISAWRSSA